MVDITYDLVLIGTTWRVYNIAQEYCMNTNLGKQMETFSSYFFFLDVRGTRKEVGERE
jgi:hypothetical protein